MSNTVKKYFGFLFVILLSFWAIKPFFQNGFFPIHDNSQVARIYEMGKSLNDDMFPVRWVNDLGYGFGYPIFNYYAPLAYYFGGTLVVLGINSLAATKFAFVFGMILSAVSMYLLARNFWGEFGGIVSAVFYQYATYHAVQVYVRGDLAEMWAYGLIPLLFLSFYKIYKDYNTHKIYTWVIIGAISYAAIILSHNLSAMMVTPFLLAFSFILVIFSKNKLCRIYYVLLTIILGVSMSAFYWFPAIFEMKYTNILSQVGGGADFHDHFVCIQQFWYSPWGYGGSAKGCSDGLSFMIGKLHIIFSVLSIFISIIFLGKNKKVILIMYMFFLGLLVSIFLQTQSSMFIWDGIKPMAFFQYPWRFLILTSFFSSFLAGSFSFFLSNFINNKIITLIGSMAIAIIVILLQVKFFVPQKIVSVTSDWYTNTHGLFMASKESDEYMPKGYAKPASYQKERLTIVGDNYQLQTYSQKTQELNAVFTLNSNRIVALAIASFPAWHVFIDGKIQQGGVPANGLFFLSKGKHEIYAVFIQTEIERVSNYISIAGILIIVAGIIYQLRYYGKSSY